MPAFDTCTLGSTAPVVRRLGLSASYRPGVKTIRHAIDQGVNLFFLYGIDGQMVKALRELTPEQREHVVLVSGAYNWVFFRNDVQRSLERRLRQLGTDYLDVFLFLGVLRPNDLTDRVRDQLHAIRERGKVRCIGISTHNRKFAGAEAAAGDLDVLMVRYNAAHRGAEREIFPFVHGDRPAIISYTATRWRSLLRRPRRWPADGYRPTASDCYRFVLSHPAVDVTLTAPTSPRQLEENLRGLDRGPMDRDERDLMRAFGDNVYRRGRFLAWRQGG